MKTNSYSYKNRKGVKQLSWDDIHNLCKNLSLEISKFNPDLILGIARGGLYPATLISHILQKELYPIRLTRRVNDVVKHKDPVWLVKPTKVVKGKKILIVDEVCDSGQTLNLVKKEVEKLGAKDIALVVLYSHTGGKDIPNYVGLVSDELIINPWDKEILKDGVFISHPEYVEAVRLQNKKRS